MWFACCEPAHDGRATKQDARRASGRHAEAAYRWNDRVRNYAQPHAVTRPAGSTWIGASSNGCPAPRHRAGRRYLVPRGVVALERAPRHLAGGPAAHATCSPDYSDSKPKLLGNSFVVAARGPEVVSQGIDTECWADRRRRVMLRGPHLCRYALWRRLLPDATVPSGTAPLRAVMVRNPGGNLQFQFGAR